VCYASNENMTMRRLGAGLFCERYGDVDIGLVDFVDYCFHFFISFYGPFIVYVTPLGNKGNLDMKKYTCRHLLFHPKNICPPFFQWEGA